MDSHVYDTLILSDLHLGADMSRARDALRILLAPVRQLRSEQRSFQLSDWDIALFAIAEVGFQE